MHVGSIPTSHTNFSKGNIMQIVIQIRTVYGNTSFYPICDKAKIFATIAGTKTLTATVLSNVAALGVEVVLQQGYYNMKRGWVNLSDEAIEQVVSANRV